MSFIEMRDISVVYNKGTQLERIVLDKANFKMNQGQFVALIGHNGSGKSTVAKIIAGESFVDSGKILIDNSDCTKLPAHKRAHLIGRVFQDPKRGTALDLTVLENLIFANSRGIKRRLLPAMKKHSRELFFNQLQAMNIGLENKLDSPASMLSGGQRQLLSLIMAVSGPAKILLLDEHTAALDPNTAKLVMSFTRRILKDHNAATIMITHDMNGLDHCDDVYKIADHKIVRVVDVNTGQQCFVGRV